MNRSLNNLFESTRRISFSTLKCEQTYQKERYKYFLSFLTCLTLKTINYLQGRVHLFRHKETVRDKLSGRAFDFFWQKQIHRQNKQNRKPNMNATELLQWLNIWLRLSRVKASELNRFSFLSKIVEKLHRIDDLRDLRRGKEEASHSFAILLQTE